VNGRTGEEAAKPMKILRRQQGVVRLEIHFRIGPGDETDYNALVNRLNRFFFSAGESRITHHVFYKLRCRGDSPWRTRPWWERLRVWLQRDHG
jgi:hypothetical protein